MAQVPAFDLLATGTFPDGTPFGIYRCYGCWNLDARPNRAWAFSGSFDQMVETYRRWTTVGPQAQRYSRGL